MTLSSAPSKIREWREHPAQMVEDLFHVKPDPWQAEALEAYPHNPYLAMKACKGPGKTATLSWISWNFLLTRPHPKCAATSISGQNLADNFWTEMAKWRNKADLLKTAFEWTKTRIFARDHPETWWMSARTWPQSADPERQADALAGLHEDYILFILDESGGIPDAVMVSAEAALSSCIEGHIIQGGNPTMLSGPLYRADRNRKANGGLWYVIEITGDPDNPKRSSRISIDWARNQIKTYGRENPWVLVNVFGQFPPSSLNALIGPAEVEAAMKRVYREYDIGAASRVMGVDVARYGLAASAICKRQGIQVFNFQKYRNLDSTQGASVVNREWSLFNADGTFIDMTGGFGTGWYDQLKLLGRAPIGVEFSKNAHDKARYYNKRAEMAFDAVEWIKAGGALPYNPELLRVLTETTYTFSGNQLLLEPKEAIEERLGHILDEFDSFILTFAEPVSPSKRPRGAPRHQFEYDPFADRPLASAVAGSYDPFR